MAKKFVTILIAAVATALLLFAGGCGDDKPKAENQSPQDILNAVNNGSTDDFNKKIDELKKTPITVEIVQNGKSEGKWSQDGKGSWRYQSSDDSSIFIFNADKNKFWTVSGDTAIESAGPENASSFEGMNPVTLMTAFAAFTYAPRTGGSDDVWEWDVPGHGKLSIELKGPQGLVSKVSSQNPGSSESDVTEFKYTDVGSVPASSFELPSGVTVQTMDSTGLGAIPGVSTGSTDSSGDTVSVPNGGYSSGSGLYQP